MSHPESRSMPRTRWSYLLRRIVIAGLVLLLLPYLLTPLYLFVTPVSTPMLWRYATGQRVVRIVTPLDAISPAVPVAVIAAEDQRYCLHRRHRLGQIAPGDRGCGGRRGSARRLHHHAADREESFSVAGPILSCARGWSFRSASGSTGPAQAADHGTLSQCRAMGSGRRIRRGGRAAAAPSTGRRSDLRLRRSGTAGGDPAQSGDPQCPPARSRGAPPGWHLPAACARRRARSTTVSGVPRTLGTWAASLGGTFLYKPIPIRQAGPAAYAGPFFLQGVQCRGCPQTKNLAVPPGHAAIRRRAQAADLYRGQGFRRAAPAASHRPQDRHV